MNAMLDRLEDASTRQQRFVADASHELRSPVAAIRTELEVAQRTAAPDEWPAVAERLLAEEARLEAVIADLLLLASLDEGAASDQVVVDLAEVAAGGGPPARARPGGRRRRGRRTGGPAMVRGSRMQLRRAVANLLDNAGRHARTTVRVSVHAARRPGPACSSTMTGRASPRPTASARSSGSPGSTTTAPARVPAAAPASASRSCVASPSATTAPPTSTPRRSAAPRVVLDLPAPRSRRA